MVLCFFVRHYPPPTGDDTNHWFLVSILIRFNGLLPNWAGSPSQRQQLHIRLEVPPKLSVGFNLEHFVGKCAIWQQDMWGVHFTFQAFK